MNEEKKDKLFLFLIIASLLSATIVFTVIAFYLLDKYW